MSYNPYVHNRQSIRLYGYDYSQAGLYFITICTEHKECLLGKITDGEMQLNEGGLIATKYWQEIPNHYQRVVLHEFVVMPNHIHGIIELHQSTVRNPISNVGA